MKAGRELDALIAARVMGWTGVRIDHPGGEEIRMGTSPEGKGGVVRHYSTDIGAAWAVVEKMRAAGWSFTLQPYPGATTWDVIFGRFGSGAWARDIADAPYAICLAALRAVGVEVDDAE
jgi:hypothetical protein